MRRNQLYIPLFIATLAIVGSSCNDFLDELPDNRTELNSEQKIAKMLVSAYPEGSANELFELYSDNTDDNSARYSYYKLSEEECYNWKDTQEEYQDTPTNLWETHYIAIASANMALEEIEKRGNPESLMPQRGEALVCRAYNHFVLANIFCNAYNTHASQELGIPYMTKVETTVQPQYGRGTLQETYEKIEKDLLDGMALISDDSYSVPKYHFTRKAAYAFAARFYLYYMKPDFSNCDEVIKYADRVLGSDPAAELRDWEALGKLSANDNVQPDAYIASTSKANLLIGSTVSNWGIILSNYMTGKRYLHNKLIASYETSRSSGLWGIPDRMYMQPFTTSGYECSMLRKGGYYAGDYLYYMPVIFSTDETLLCRAEAYTLKKNYPMAAADLTTWEKAYTSNKQTLTPGMINEYYDKMDYYNPTQNPTPKKKLQPDFTIESGIQENFIHCILHMRRIATLHEGLRWPDIKRYGIVIYHRSIANNNIVVTDEMPVNDARRAMQIPKSVVLAGMQPNPRTEN